MQRYDHRQPGRVMWAAMGGGALVIVLVVGGLSLAVPEEDRPVVWWIMWGTCGMLAVFAWLFGSLRVSIDEEEIAIRFGPGWPRKRIPLAGIRGAEPVRNSWWYGWGIRLTPHGWLWNVSGYDAVQIQLDDGRLMRIGTDEPQELTAAIRQALDA